MAKKKEKATTPPVDSLTTLVLAGEVTVGSLHELRERFLAALEGQGQVHVRTRELTYMDAAALQFIWALRRESKARGRPLQIELPNKSVMKDAERLGMQGVFTNQGTP